MSSARGSLSGFTGGLSGLGGSLSTSLIGPLAAAAAGAATFAGAYALASSSLQKFAEIESAEVAFGTLTGSAEKGKQVLQDIRDFAASTPFQLPGLNEASKKLLAFGTSTDQLIPTLKAVGDISAGVGAPIEEMAEIYGKAQTSGTLFAEDINQLSGRGIPIIRELAKQFGVAESEVKGLVSEGKVGFGNLQQAFKDLTSEGGQFNGMMDAQSGTLAGLWSTLMDGVDSVLVEIGAGLVDAFNLKDVIKGFSSFVEGDLKGFVSNAVSYIKPIVTALIGFGQQIGQWFMAFVPIVQQYASTLIAGWTMIGDVVFTVGKAIWDAVYPIISSLLPDFGAMFATMRETVIYGLAMAEYAFTHWREVVDIVGIGIAYAMEKISNDIKHVMTVAAPQYVMWFATSTVKGFTTLAVTLSQTWSNMWESLKNFEIPTIDFSPVLKSFEKSWSRIPEIAARQQTGTEKALFDMLTASSGSFLDGATKFAEDRVKGLLGDKATSIVDETKKQIDELAINAPITGEKKGTGKGAQFAGALSKGSSEAIALINANSVGGRNERAEEKKFLERIAKATERLEKKKPRPEMATIIDQVSIA
ncbi:MAG TPA: tape measure protein [Pirellulaceae bacterium]|jgi:tape measure domain-containing protein|nr:tape measure protein [Pirellulaceae bacterium]